ncbi:hypothetical protein DEU56DRAFT_759443 [Suillus clintonianus]|uniref:uncharacterized protein n=1 Tax=Suillus clintonianus TaxID=1904413 RepID=UPI001B8818F5|nr:uncharacterized protein DEU56DRAFT_759443 [Suillus clintonianus]KAG2125115.1 hypothetical protein DEU56DRAFT_759443 [Suillus clintonianus]
MTFVMSSDSLDSSESKVRLGQAQSTATSSPPTSVATGSIGSSPAKNIGSPVVSLDNSEFRVEWGRPVDIGKHAAYNPRKRPMEYTLFQNGTRDEDCDLPTKKLKTLQTTWNFTAPSSEATNYLNGRMLELSRITRRAIAARIRYQRLRSRELDLIKGILVDETELCQTQLTGVDTQIGSIRNMLGVGGAAAIWSAGAKFDPDDAAGSWCESSSDESNAIAAASRGSSACPSDDSNL